MVGVALVLVIEGLLPAINPAGWRTAMRQLAELDDRTLRTIGLSSMIAGVVLLTLIR